MWQEAENGRCGGCGHPVNESMVGGALYEVERYTCHACEARSIAMEQDQKDAQDGSPTHGIHYGAVRLKGVNGVG